MDQRFSETEVEEILDLASRGNPNRHGALADGGMSLAEIQDIGREVGIAPEDVVWAASAITRHSGEGPQAGSLPKHNRRIRMLTLEDTPTDAEWDRMVVALREIFAVPGSIERSGTLRTWRGAGVAVHGEPAGSGYRIRIDAKNGQAWQMFLGGIVAVVVAILLAAVITASGTADAVTTTVCGLLAAFGVGWSGYGRYALSKWSARTDRQIEDAVRRLSDGG